MGSVIRKDVVIKHFQSQDTLHVLGVQVRSLVSSQRCALNPMRHRIHYRYNKGFTCPHGIRTPIDYLCSTNKIVLPMHSAVWIRDVQYGSLVHTIRPKNLNMETWPR